MRIPRVMAAAGSLLGLAMLAACSSEVHLRVDGLPVENADSYLSAVDAQWETFREESEIPAHVSADSRCFFLVYDDVALNSVVCGPVFWLGNESPTWDYYPLITRLTADGSQFTAVADGEFRHDYPMSEADDLYRPDHASPADGGTLTEPPAPVAAEDVVLTDSLPDPWRLRGETQYGEPITLIGGPIGPDGIPSTCVQLSRILWSTHVGTGSDVLAPRSGLFLTLVPTEPACLTPRLPLVAGGPDVPEDSGEVTLTLDGTEIPVDDWSRTAAYQAPSGAESAVLGTTIAGTPVSVDLITGEPDAASTALTEVTPATRVDGAGFADVPLEGEWVVAADVTPHTLDALDSNAALYPWLPQFGAAPDGHAWLVAGFRVEANIHENVSRTVASDGRVEIDVSIAETGAPAQVFLDEARSPDALSRAVTVVVAVPEAATAVDLTLGLNFSGWQTTLAPVTDLPELRQDLTIRVEF